jgi:hypothetical protein
LIKNFNDTEPPEVYSASIWADEKKLRQALKIDPVFVPII